MDTADPNMPWVYRELASLSKDLEKLADNWEPPKARSLLTELQRVVRVLQELHPEPDPWGLNTRVRDTRP